MFIEWVEAAGRVCFSPLPTLSKVDGTIFKFKTFKT